MAPTPSRVACLSVTAGTHAGVTLDLPDTGYRVGAGQQDDIVLSDAGVVPRHLSVRVYGQRVAVEASGGDITVNGQPVRCGQGMKASGLVSIGVGQAQLRIEPPSNALMTPALVGAVKKWSATAATLAVAGVVLFSLTVDAGSAQANTPSRFSSAWHFLTGSDASAASAHDAQDGQSASLTAQARDALRQRLAKAHLDALQVTDRKPGQLTIGGSLADANKPDWLAIHQWFDGTYGRQLMLINHIQPQSAPAKPDLAFSAIWLGDNPYVVDASGHRRYPGAALQDGWVLSSIESGKITVTRGKQRYTYDTRGDG